MPSKPKRRRHLADEVPVSDRCEEHLARKRRLRLTSPAILLIGLLTACGDDGDPGDGSGDSASADTSETATTASSGTDGSSETGGGSALCEAPGGQVPVCDRQANESICVEFWGAWPTLDAMAQTCEDEGGTFSPASNCPTGGALDGWCVVQFGDDRTANFSYDMTIDVATCTEPWGYSGAWCPA
jgi:hypothetical protein